MLFSTLSNRCCVPVSVLFSFVVKRRVGSFSKIVRWYRQFWEPKKYLPPYSHVCQIGDPVLRHEAQPVEASDICSVRIQKVIHCLREVLLKYDAVGLSAPQIGVALQIFIVQFTEAHKRQFTSDTLKLREMTTVPLKVFVNPKMKVLDYERVVFPEACESIRGFHADVPRYRSVVISGAARARRGGVDTPRHTSGVHHHETAKQH
ncbi:peptide deformylase, mitochondrial-like isoform X2 [Bacillus rossius redtenbacheri]|uniref:peptide deformylase, mitochondrial-like isoform X2 n=1 Tax=Bacillus rossius redtenbacheri TaxID=93214 RepID=UPI002FDE58DC